MTIELGIYFGRAKNSEVISKMADDFIAMAKRLNALVIENGPSNDNSGNFYALTNGIVIHAYGVQNEASERIVSELNPISSSVNKGKRLRFDNDHEYEIDLKWEEVKFLDSLPKRIAEALQTDPHHTQCSSCGRTIKLDMGIKFCPHCRESLNTQEWNAGLTFCSQCREDPEGGSVYHHSYNFCPRCGKKLKRLSDAHWFDYVDVEEQDFMGGGRPLSEFDFGDEMRQASSRKRRS